MTEILRDGDVWVDLNNILRLASERGKGGRKEGERREKGGRCLEVNLPLPPLSLLPLVPLRLLEYPANLRFTSNKEVVPPELFNLTCCQPPLVELVTAFENAVGVLYSIVPIYHL